MTDSTKNSASTRSDVTEGCATRITAISDGGDWSDASVDHLRVPKNMDLRVKQSEWRSWLKESDEYLRFPDWLVEHTEAEDATSEVDSFHMMW